jgi:pentapeptide MXKDX repeat protein
MTQVCFFNHERKSSMRNLIIAVFACCLSLAAGGAFAAEMKKDTMGKGDAMAKDSMGKDEMKKPAKTSGAKKDDMAKDMSKGGMTKDEMMKK